MNLKHFYIFLKFNTFIILITLISTFTFGQNYESFQGKLVYSIEMADTSLQRMIPSTIMTIYTNDTIVRIENETNQLGKQIIIKHTILNKSILLIDNKDTHYAIQTDLSKKLENVQGDSTKIQYTFKKKLGKIKILNLKANRMSVGVVGQDKKIEILYLKQMSPKYIDAFEGIPGLPVRYYIKTEYGIAVYTLIFIEKTPVDKDLFGIPSNYKRVSFDQFLDEVLKENEK